MKKKARIFIVGLIVLLMAGGLVFAGCSGGGGNDDNSGGGKGCSWEGGNVCFSDYMTTISCDKESCAVNKGHGGGNTTLKCNC